jgi:hypothetical protein
LPSTRAIPDRDVFYVADPISSIPDLWQQEAVRALQQGKAVVSIRDVDPTKSRTIIATPGVASIRARTRAKF